jgi:hypothetical protein
MVWARLTAGCDVALYWSVSGTLHGVVNSISAWRMELLIG